MINIDLYYKIIHKIYIKNVMSVTQVTEKYSKQQIFVEKTYSIFDK